MSKKNQKAKKQTTEGEIPSPGMVDEVSAATQGTHTMDRNETIREGTEGNVNQELVTVATSTPKKNEVAVRAPDIALKPVAPNANGLMFQEYGHTQKLPAELLDSLKLTQISYDSQAAVKIPYFDATGQEVAARFVTRDPESETGLSYAWKRKTKPIPYGLWRLDEATKEKSVVIVGSEIESHVLWSHNVPSLAVVDETVQGLVECLLPLTKVKKISVIKNGAGSGHALRLLGGSALKEKVNLVTLTGGHTSLASIHIQSPQAFRKNMKALSQSCSLAEHEEQLRRERAAELWDICKDLAGQPDIPTVFADDLERSGIVGEERLAKTIYLAVTSRLLERPVSVVVKGPSACGKSATTQGTLKFFPPSASYELSSMSPKALLYSPESFVHRMLVICELDGLDSKFATYLMRSLQSEGRIKYETVVGGTTVLLEKDGPTGLILTTTKTQWHPENETRMLSLNVDDSPELTKRVLAAMARGDRQEVDLSPWHALQEWLELSDRRVTIPFAMCLPDLIPENLPPRVRRDFPALLNLIKANAILHQATRQRDENGQIVATLEDYAAVRELVVDAMAHVLQNAVPSTVRTTVEAVKALTAGTSGDVSETTLAGALDLNKSSVSRRLKLAAEGGYLKNLESKAGVPARWVVGEPMPEDQQLLPTVAQLEDALQCCTPKA